MPGMGRYLLYDVAPSCRKRNTIRKILDMRKIVSGAGIVLNTVFLNSRTPELPNS
jgi:hypothetical protein